jgi:hypothetical protein
MKKTGWIKFALIGLLLAGLISPSLAPVLAQTPEASPYTLSLRRDLGFSSGSQIRGTFTVNISGPDGYTKVVYTLDGQPMIELTSAPYAFQFNTDSYALGVHELAAQVTAADGKVYTTPPFTRQFVDAATENAVTRNILFPILGVVLGLIVVVVVAQTVLFRRRSKGIPMGAARNYTLAGGSICPHCHRPTPLHLFGFNVGLGKFDYCEACGKWSVMRRVPIESLRAAEEAEKVQAAADESLPSFNEPSEEDKLREMIDKSKYDGR